MLCIIQQAFHNPHNYVCVCWRGYGCVSVCVFHFAFFVSHFTIELFESRLFFPLCLCSVCYSIAYDLHWTNSYFLPLLNTFKAPYSNYTHALVCIQVHGACLRVWLPSPMSTRFAAKHRSNVVIFHISFINSMPSLYTQLCLFIGIHTVFVWPYTLQVNISDMFGLFRFFMAANWKTSKSIEWDEFLVFVLLFRSLIFWRVEILVVLWAYVNHTMKCGRWYPGIFTHIHSRTHRHNSNGIFVCMCEFVVRINTHTYACTNSILVSISMGRFPLFTHHFPATFHSSVFLWSTTWSKNKNITMKAT